MWNGFLVTPNDVEEVFSGTRAINFNGVLYGTLWSPDKYRVHIVIDIIL